MHGRVGGHSCGRVFSRELLTNHQSYIYIYLDIYKKDIRNPINEW